MAFASHSSFGEPMGEMNTTPLIDVMLVILMVLIMTVPLSINSLEFELPNTDGPITQPDPVKNRLELTATDQLLWNGNPVSGSELAGLLERVRNMKPEPEVQFQPHAQASYQASAGALRIVKASGVTRFGFLGNEKYRAFASAN